MDKQTYTIGGSEYTQDFLTIGQTIEVAKILKGVEFKDMDMLSILEALEKSSKIEKLFNTILVGPKIDITKLKPAVAVQVVADFFCLNDVLQIIGTVTSLMSDLNESEALTSLQTIGKTMQTGTTSSQLSAMETSPNTGTSEKK